MNEDALYALAGIEDAIHGIDRRKPDARVLLSGNYSDCLYKIVATDLHAWFIGSSAAQTIYALAFIDRTGNQRSRLLIVPIEATTDHDAVNASWEWLHAYRVDQEASAFEQDEERRGDAHFAAVAGETF